VVVGELISFTSCALDADNQEWNFGDGSSIVNGTNASHIYTSPGVYQVELKAFSKKDKKWDRSTLLINVVPAKTRYLTRFQLNAYNITNASGQSWDVQGGINPDVFISYGLENSSNRSFINPPKNDLALNELPVFWDFETTVSKPVLSNAQWVIDILDSEVTAGNSVPEVMHSFSINPATIAPVEPGIIRLTENNFQLELHFIEL
jgi:PKD repeat protein